MINDKREAVRSLISGILEKKGDRRTFADEDSLILSGRLESLDVLEIVVFLEENFALDFADSGLDQRELDSVGAILARAEG